MAAIDARREAEERELAAAAMDNVLVLAGRLAEARAEIEHLKTARRPLLTYKQTAEVLGLSIETVRQLVNAGDLAVIRVGAAPRVAPEDLDAFIAERRTVAGSRAGRLAVLTQARRRA